MGARKPRPVPREHLTARKCGVKLWFLGRSGGAGAASRDSGAAPLGSLPSCPAPPARPAHAKRPGFRPPPAAAGPGQRGERGPLPPRWPPRSPRRRPRLRSSRTKAPAARPGPLPGPAPLRPPRPGGPARAGAHHLPGRRRGDGRARPPGERRRRRGPVLEPGGARRPGAYLVRKGGSRAGWAVPGPGPGPEEAAPSARSPPLRAPARRASRAPSQARRAAPRAVPRPEQPKLERRQAAPAERRDLQPLCGAARGRQRAGETSRARRVAGGGCSCRPDCCPAGVRGFPAVRNSCGAGAGLPPRNRPGLRRAATGPRTAGARRLHPLPLSCTLTFLKSHPAARSPLLVYIFFFASWLT